MRRRDVDNSSFDLFLDTICNTFGGVVFLAILLAILIQTRAIVKTPEQRDESPPPPQVVRALTSELDEAHAAYAAIDAALAKLPPADTSANDDQYRDLVQQHELMQEQLANVFKTHIETTQLLAERLVKNAEIKQQNAEVPQQLENIESKVDTRNASLKTLVNNRQTMLRLPRDKVSNAYTVLTLLVGSRVYLAKTPSHTSRAFHNKHVTATSTIGGGFIVKPRQGGGWALNDPSVTAMIQDAHSMGHTVTVAVWPDSYGEFSTIKDALVENDVPYQLLPQRQGEELTVAFGRGQNRVQ